ncbi:MAG: hypothetical protein FWC97_08785 [Treponema sp.]|nr:hypothetical protein [Treponema sp.]
MKKKVSGIITIIVISLFFSIAGCEIQDPTPDRPMSVAAPLRALPVPISNNPADVVVLGSYTDGVHNFFLIDGGFVRNVFVGTMQEVHFNGVTPITSSATTITETSVSTFIKETASSSFRFHESHVIDANVNAGPALFRVNVDWRSEWTRTTTQERSIVTSFESVERFSQQQTTSFTVGLNNEPAGWYRYSIYAVADIFFVIKTCLDNELLLDWEAAVCLRSDSLIPHFEFSANGIFDNTPVNHSLLSLPPYFWQDLPQPEHHIADKFAGRLAAGFGHSLFIDADGILWAWGANTEGQLGIGNTTNRHSPVQVRADIRFKSVAAASGHSLAIDENGNLWAWGNNSRSQLGDGTTTQRNVPVIIREGVKFSEISAGTSYSLAIDVNGNLWVWGLNVHGQLGDGTTIDRHIPVQIKTGTRFKAIAASSGVFSLHSLAIDVHGNLWAWGSNTEGQLGDGTTTNRHIPVQIQQGTTFVTIFAGNNHSLAMDDKGNLWAWGSNIGGQLGDGTTTNRHISMKIKTVAVFISATAGWHNNLAIDVHGNLWAWGSNAEGQLGDGTITDRHIPVLTNRSDIRFATISTSRHSLAIDTQGRLWSWGINNWGQLGNNSTTNRNFPALVNFN